MPTGYTASVQDGKITTFVEYAMACARAFGALVLMRDEPDDAPIPDFEPAPFYGEELARYQARMSELEAMSPFEAQRQCQISYSQALSRWRERSIEDAQQRVRYQAMIEKVKRWQPPTRDHVKLKEFMLSQLTDSLAHDCGGRWNEHPRLARWPDWLAEQKRECARLIARYEVEHQKEVDRTGERNDWVRELRTSLANTNF